MRSETMYRALEHRAVGNDPELRAQRRGFEALFRTCLRVSPDDVLLILVDEGIRPLRRALVETTRELGCEVTLIDIPFRHQLDYVEQMSLRGGNLQIPSAVIIALDNATVVVNALSGDLRTSQVRGAIIGQQRRKRCRLAHIPGLDQNVLAVLADTPIEQVESDCELVAWALGEAQDVAIVTRSGNGRTHRLEMQLDGWCNEPQMSSGIIHPDSWGNVPPAETFACPRSATVNGTICINGSLPHRVLADGDEALLRFENGRLVHWQSHGRTRPAHFFTRERARASQLNDQQWCTLSELGIGLNPVITRLTGNSLFDEKAHSTLHVAIGDNYRFGHSVRSLTHADLVTRSASLVLNGQTVMEDGVLQFEGIRRWRRTIQFDSLDLKRHRRLDLVESKLERTGDGRLVRRLFSAGRVGYVNMTDDDDARALEAHRAASRVLARRPSSRHHVRLSGVLPEAAR